MSLHSYDRAQAGTENPRLTEYRVFAQVTKALTEAAADGTARESWAEALNWNRRLWMTLQLDLANDTNRLPEVLRAQLISVAIWVDRHTSLVLRGDGEIEPLIGVNRTIMEGLSAAESAMATTPPREPAAPAASYA